MKYEDAVILVEQEFGFSTESSVLNPETGLGRLGEELSRLEVVCNFDAEGSYAGMSIGWLDKNGNSVNEKVMERIPKALLRLSRYSELC